MHKHEDYHIMSQERIQERIQHLYDIPLFQFNSEEAEELRRLEDEMEEAGFERTKTDSLDAIHYIGAYKADGQFFCGVCGWSDISTFPHSH